MGKDLYDAFPEAREIYDRAKNLTGTDWAAISFEGDKETLFLTSNTQPCLFINSCAILHSLGEAAKFEGTAGHSLGEYSALYAAGVLKFEDALLAVVERGKLMAQAKSGGMLAPIGADDEKIFAVVANLQKEGVLVVANINAPGKFVVSGDIALLDKATSALQKDAGAKKVFRLPVSGAFHSPLMEDAGKEMSDVLSKINFNPPKIPFYANASGRSESDPGQIRSLLVAQITSPVRWIDQIRAMNNDGFAEFVEVGSGKVLQGLVARIVPDAITYGISNADDVNKEKSNA